MPQKDGIEYPLIDYEKLLYDALMSTDAIFKDKHLWVKKATRLGVTEFMLRMMAWICTTDNGTDNGQMYIVTGPNIDIATKSIRIINIQLLNFDSLFILDLSYCLKCVIILTNSRKYLNKILKKMVPWEKTPYF